MRYLQLEEVVELHARVIKQSGGAAGIRDRASLESSVAQPLQSFDGRELYPSLAAKAASLGYFLIANHSFMDGNKRVGHAAVEVTLVLNGFELSASVDEQERVVLAIASGTVSREEFASWIEPYVRRLR